MSVDFDLPWTVDIVPDVVVEYVSAYGLFRASAEGLQAFSHKKDDAENMVIGMVEAKQAREMGE